MSYDKELQIMRTRAMALACLNAAVALVNLWAYNWLVALAGSLWTAACLLMLKVAEIHQSTRDEVRLVRAGIHSALEDEE